VGGGGYKERVWEVNMVEYYALMNENGKMRPDETIPGMGEGIKENDGGVNLAMIYCKNFCKCHNAPPSATIIKKNLRRKKIG
jgi:hypothetical protein